MSQAQEDRAREKFAEKMRQKTAKAKADAEARRVNKPLGGKTTGPHQTKP
jgi:hypothetical protein